MFRSGNHEEVTRDAGDAGGEGDRSGDKKKPKRVSTYMFTSGDENEQSLPMFVVGYEELYNSAHDTVMAIRIWHFVFDPGHSTSFLARKLMDENSDELDHSGQAHCPNNMRRTNLVASSQQSRALLGSSLETAELELVAGMCYRHITDLNEYKNLLAAYAGQTDKSPGLHPLPGMEQYLPQGLFNSKFEEDEAGHGCTHPLSIEWTFNAKRQDVLRAGLVYVSDGEEMDIDPLQMDVASYFDLKGDDPDVFNVPQFVKDDKKCFFFQTIPFKKNVFDMILPRTIAGAVSPGKALLKLFQKRFAQDVPLDSPSLLNLFNSTMTGRDQWMEKQVKALSDSITNFDTFACSREQRKDAQTAKKAASRGLASYGQMDGDDHVVEPREVLKEHAYTTANIHAKLIQPWAHEKKKELQETEVELRTGEENTAFSGVAGIDHEHFQGLKKNKLQFKEEYNAIMEELCKLHLSKMERAFTSRMEAESIPAGWKSVWKGLMAELAEMPDKTANVAYALDMQMTDSDRTLFGHMQNWLGVFFEDGAQALNPLVYRAFPHHASRVLSQIALSMVATGASCRNCSITGTHSSTHSSTHTSTSTSTTASSSYHCSLPAALSNSASRRCCSFSVDRRAMERPCARSVP